MRRIVNEITRTIVALWLIGAYTAVFLVYVQTRDPTVILIWTSFVALASVVFAYFFQKEEEK